MLGAFMTIFSTTQHIDSANDLQGSRGYPAARMGAEWAVATICNGGSPGGLGYVERSVNAFVEFPS